MRRLYTRIYVHFLLVLFVVAAATLAIFALGFRGEVVHKMAHDYARLSSHVIAEVVDDRAKLADTLDKLADVVDADVTVWDLEGNVLASTGTLLPRPPRLQDVQGHRRFGRGKRRFFTMPVRDGQGNVIAVMAARPWRKHSGYPSPLKHLLALGLALGFVGLAVRPLARRISRPVEKLTEATRRFGGGELGFRIEGPQCRHDEAVDPHPVRRRDELGELMRAWNEMAGRIETLVSGHRELLANVSHELRSPLARIRVALELLPKTPESGARIADVEQDLAELERLIDDVLTASRLEAAGLPARPEPCAVASLFDQLRERATHDPLLAGKQLRVAQPLPEITLVADAALLKRALWNLVENAAKYGAPPIVLSAEQSGDRVRLTVSDAGPGVPPSERETVFAPFRRLDKARTPDAGGRTGFGLGLTIAKRVAEAHGGTIRVEGDPANRFVLDLPTRR